MNEDCQYLSEIQKIEHYEDEIELIDILRVIWKWKYLIISGTVVCGLIAAIISFNMSKIYSVNMTLRPGILSIGEGGENVYIDSSQNIKALIESGALNNDILKYLNDAKMDKDSKRLNFEVTIPKNSNTIKVKYETSDIKKGVVIIDLLGKSLIDTYRDLVKYFKNEYDMKLNLIKSETEYIKTAIKSYKKNLKNIDKRVNELMADIELIKNKTADLIVERNKLFSKNPKENNILFALLYRNTIQHNLQLSNLYQNEINNYIFQKELELQKIGETEREIEKKSYEIKRLQSKKDYIQNIQILQSATSSPYLIKPRTKLNVMLGSVAGLFFMMFLVFFLEYLSKYKKREMIANKL